MAKIFNVSGASRSSPASPTPPLGPCCAPGCRPNAGHRDRHRWGCSPGARASRSPATSSPVRSSSRSAPSPTCSTARWRGSGPAGKFGALLDSTCDRIADGAVFGAVAWWLGVHDRPWGAAAAVVCLAAGQVVSYVKARAEGLGFTANVGLIERAERLILLGIGGLLSAFGITYGLDYRAGRAGRTVDRDGRPADGDRLPAGPVPRSRPGRPAPARRWNGHGWHGSGRCREAGSAMSVRQR